MDEAVAVSDVEMAEPANIWMETTTRAFSKEIPMQIDYNQPRYYVRKCFAKYYKLVKFLLEVKRVRAVTITGSPGVGKSLFYAYFLQRYSFENKDTTIISASFAEHGPNSIRDQVVVWKNGEVLGVAKDVNSAMDALIVKSKKQAGGKLFYLYDGPPIFKPQTAQMVCFTSPNKAWFRMVAKDQSHRKLFMPLWDLHELRTAAEELRLEMNTMDIRFNREEGSKDEGFVMDRVEQRYQFFGGVARECLSTDESFVSKRRFEIEGYLDQIESVDNLRSLFSKVEHWVVSFNETESNGRDWKKRIVIVKVQQLYYCNIDCWLSDNLHYILINIVQEGFKILACHRDVYA